jgi:cysteinyl-tRNA synthetase
MMQTHYGSTLDFSNEALQASEKGYATIDECHENIRHIKNSCNTSTSNIAELKENCYDAMNDDFQCTHCSCQFI